MSRYVQRAEHVARLLEVNFHLDLDLHGVVTGPHDLQWEALLEILQLTIPPEDERPLPEILYQMLTFDMQTSTSIMCCINRSRNNARSIRGSISSDMWRELNKFYWQLTDADFRAHAQESPHDLYHSVQMAGQLFQGVCDATLTHDEGWQFIQLGKYLERAEKTLRILDVRFRQLRRMVEPSELSLANLHWASVLKACTAYQAYQRIYISRVEPDRVIEFLLFNPEFPHSVRFCLEGAAKALADISGGGDTGRAGHILGRAISDLKYTDPDEVFAQGLPELLEATSNRCTQASVAVNQQYALV
jgi:uncharacterized alpha-E superfamily protein